MREGRDAPLETRRASHPVRQVIPEPPSLQVSESLRFVGLEHLRLIVSELKSL
jgi:hypothetical protein